MSEALNDFSPRASSSKEGRFCVYDSAARRELRGTFESWDDAEAASTEANKRSSLGLSGDYRARFPAMPTTTNTESDLAATENHGTISVRDAAGGVWHPSDEAAVEIAAAADPGETAMQMCRENAWRGEWHS